MLVVPLALIVGYGLLRIVTSGCSASCATRCSPGCSSAPRAASALQTFVHLHELSLRFTSTGRPAACRGCSSAA